MKPRRELLSPGLKRWLSETADQAVVSAAQADTSVDERRTVVVRLSGTAEPERVSDRLREAGGSVQTTGAASVTAVMTADGLRRLIADAESWLVAIEEPRRLFPSAGHDVPDR